MRVELPGGTVTFLFTDVEGSTRLLDELGAGAYARVLAEHRQIVRDEVASFGGVEVDTQGDAFFLVFARAVDGVDAAAAITTRLASQSIRLRMGLHTGAPLLAEEGYVGEDVHRAARIAAAGHGGQVVLSASTAALVDRPMRDLGEHRFKDLRAAERVFQLGDMEFPPLRSLYRSNLPVSETPFLGRATELAGVSSLLSGADTRLLSLVGPGGVGKTRLALRSVAEVSDRFPAGAYWVPCASIRAADDLLPAIAAAIGVRDTSSASPLDHLVSAIGDGRVLLLLDNLEQLLPAAAAEVDAILSACPNLVVVLTSRERLQVPAEQVYDVPPMTDSDARALFRSRSAAVSVELTESDDLSTLCRRLDNLPLALELAAARTVLFSPGQLLERLGERLDLLRAGRGVDDRQKTLRATIEWSHSLLSDQEQALFRRLSVFLGGCTFESAEAVAGADPDVLQSLLAKSLLRRRIDARRPRFWMLATIREFAAERLAASAEVDKYRDRHMKHYAMVAEECIDDTMHERDDLERLDAERENLRLALESALATNPELAVELAPRLFLSWVRRGDLREGRTRLATALDHAPDATETARAPALRAAARLAYWQGDLDAADRYGREAVEQFWRVGDDRGAGLALSGLGFSAYFRGDHERAELLFQESLTALSATDQQFHQLQPLSGLARVMSARGEHARAVAMHQQVVERLRRDGSRVRLALSLNDLGDAQELAGWSSAAVRSFEESVSLSRASGHTGALANALAGLAGIRRVTAPTAALAHYHESLQLYREMEQPSRIANCLRGGAAILSARGDVGAATKLLGAASAAQALSVIAVRPGELSDVEALQEHCRVTLGPEGFAKAWDEGAALSADDAADWALGLWATEAAR